MNGGVLNNLSRYCFNFFSNLPKDNLNYPSFIIFILGTKPLNSSLKSSLNASFLSSSRSDQAAVSLSIFLYQILNQIEITFNTYYFTCYK